MVCSYSNIYITYYHDNICIDAIIRSEATNTTVFKGMPFTLRCLSRCRSDFYQVVWTTNKAFVKNDKQHTIWSSPPFKDTQSHHLTTHAANNSTDYQCSLIALTGRIIDSAEQHVHVEEPSELYILTTYV